MSLPAKRRALAAGGRRHPSGRPGAQTVADTMNMNIAAPPPTSDATGTDREPVAELVGISRHFATRGPGGRRASIRAVDDVDLALRPHQTVGLVGESGSGKSTVARLLLRLIPPTSGRVILDGEDITAIKGASLRRRRRKMQLVFQDPYSSFDPLSSISSSIDEALRVHTDLPRPERQQRMLELLDQVRLPADFARRRPEKSPVGSCNAPRSPARWRRNRSSWLSTNPSARSTPRRKCRSWISSQSSRRRLGIAYLFISHDLNLVRALSDEVAVIFGRHRRVGPGREPLRCTRAPVHPSAAGRVHQASTGAPPEYELCWEAISHLRSIPPAAAASAPAARRPSRSARRSTRPPPKAAV